MSKYKTALRKVPFTLSDVFWTCVFVVTVFALLFFMSGPAHTIPIWILSTYLQLPQSLQVLGVFILQEAIFIIPLLFLILWKYKKSFLRSLSIRAYKLWKTLGSIIKWYILYLIISIILLSIFAALHIELPGFGPGEDIVPIFGDDKYTLPVIILVALILGPIVEELFFRGFLFLTLLKYRGYFIATILSSILFSLVHVDLGAFFPRFILGLILNQIVMENNKSIVASWGFHVMNNSIALIIQLNIDKFPV